MAAELSLSNPNVVHFGGYRWWADRGLIHVENKTTGDYETLSVRQTLIRLRGLNDMVRNSASDDEGVMSQFFGGTLDEHQRFIEQMIEVIRRAQQQGQPDDPSAVRDAKRRRPKSVVVPTAHTRMF